MRKFRAQLRSEPRIARLRGRLKADPEMTFRCRVTTKVDARDIPRHPVRSRLHGAQVTAYLGFWKAVSEVFKVVRVTHQQLVDLRSRFSGPLQLEEILKPSGRMGERVVVKEVKQRRPLLHWLQCNAGSQGRRIQQEFPAVHRDP